MGSEQDFQFVMLHIRSSSELIQTKWILSFFIFRYHVNFIFCSSCILLALTDRGKSELFFLNISKHINMILSHLKISSVANTVLKRAFNADICEGQRRGMEARYYAYMQILYVREECFLHFFTVHCLPTPIPFVASVHPVRFLHYISRGGKKHYHYA